MFFGSRNCCKSVLAAELAAVLAWSALARGDRVGGLVFGQREHRETRPRRSRRSVLALLNHVAELNRALPGPGNGDGFDFADALLELRRIARPGSSLFIVSDFADGLAGRALEQVFQLSRHMEITALHCSDPMERQLPRAGRYAVTDGRRRAELHTGGKTLRRRYAERYRGALEQLKSAYGGAGIPVIECCTLQAPAEILETYYARRGGKGR